MNNLEPSKEKLQATLNALRDCFIDQNETLDESDILSQQEHRWKHYHSKHESFVCTTKDSLSSIVKLKILGGYKTIDDPLAKGVLPDGRFYQFLQKPLPVIAKEKAQALTLEGHLKWRADNYLSNLSQYMNTALMLHAKLKGNFVEIYEHEPHSIQR